ncbi:anaphase promoting complex subunit cdc16 [Linnemannia schmuckeri]|uniref:Anaphase promoting complex subunit cdc16 n=1 Tax=Linnemannia schmuckeri TaxID=64567 RepID=A0A9P5RXF8_9FUNG|nr:anaphase promoting complex subunit cdc16 [Linnemannia schmuckeri]
MAPNKRTRQPSVGSSTHGTEPTTPNTRQRQASSHSDTNQPAFQTPNNNYNSRLRATRSTPGPSHSQTPGAASSSPAHGHTPGHAHGHGSGTWSMATSPNTSYTTPTRPSAGGGGGSGGYNDRTSFGTAGGGTAAPGSASSTASNTNITPRAARGPTLPQFNLTRTTSANGSLNGPGSGNSSFNNAIASLVDLSPGGPSSSTGGGPGAGQRTPNALTRKAHAIPGNNAHSSSNQNMRVIPSPFAKSPASWLDISLPSPVKGYGSAASTSSAFAAGGSSTAISAPGAGSGMRSIFGPGLSSIPGSARSETQLSGDRHGDYGVFDAEGHTSAVDFFAPEETNRSRYLDRDQDRELDTVGSMRAWRTDAMHQHMYRTAAYWGDKVLSITDDSNDVFWLSQVYYLMGEYGRAINLLKKQNLVESSVACRFLAVQCLIRTQKWQEALEYLGEENQFLTKSEVSDSQQSNSGEGGIKLEASMCFLRGIVFKNLHNIDVAKQCFKEALRIDVKCYDALDIMISNNMLTTSEEQELINELEFSKQLQGQDAEFVKMLYQSKMKKYDRFEEQEMIYTTLATKFQTENADLLHAKADVYFTQGRFEKCLECTKRILEMDKFNLACIPMHLVSLYELDLKNELFLIGHELVDQHPKEAVTWFAVGVYYYLIGNIPEARRYFIKASTIDSHYGPAWIGFGHTFAMEGEHEKAISAYGTSTRLFQGSHLGPMYIGMQHLQQNNAALAEKYFDACLTICDSDPLLLNEMGVMYYQLGRYDEAITSLHKVVKKLEHSQRKNVIWETTWLNLAHAYRKQGNYKEAETYFLKVDSIAKPGPTRASALVGLGFIYQIMGETKDAMEAYHKALAIRPGDQTATDMLQRIMEEKVRDYEMEWMKDALPEEMMDDDRFERNIRALEQHRATTARALAALGSGPGSGAGVGSSVAVEGRGDAAGIEGTGRRKGTLSGLGDGGGTSRGKAKKENGPED